MTDRKPHPHFDDRGTLDWHTRLEEALERAKAEDKKVFIEFGRELCSQCRTLVQNVIPRSDVAPLLQEHFVAVAADADQPEDAVLQLAMKLEDAMMLPFVMFTDAQGNFLEGYSGAATPPHLKKVLARLTNGG